MALARVQGLLRRSLYSRRHYSSPAALTALDIHALDEYIASPKKLVLEDTFSVERVSDLFITLPTRDGTRSPYQAPRLSAPVGYGWHLAFFHARTPESLLSPDGTDGAVEFGPPVPFTRRMWASGRMSWNPEQPLLIGEKATSTSTFGSVEKKGFDTENPMVFVTQKIDITMAGKSHPSIKEERSHVYVAESVSPNNTPRAERLVHGPLTALMLLETMKFHKPMAQVAHFEYRARNPVIVNQPMTINGVWADEHTATVWCVNEEGVVGMTGTIKLHA
ncbi:hypothetical protein FB451DRAFT_1343006 [Mycena latifolia]|nr:hypothetical protein FB451DRAFT_1343006 [Mycena latifolia]